jgi:hypothetical protein
LESWKFVLSRKYNEIASGVYQSKAMLDHDVAEKLRHEQALFVEDQLDGRKRGYELAFGGFVEGIKDFDVTLDEVLEVRKSWMVWREGLDGFVVAGGSD